MREERHINTSEVKTLSLGMGVVRVRLQVKSRVALRFQSATHKSHLVCLKHWFEEIASANVKQMFDLIVAGILPETFVVNVGLVNLDWATLIAHHELLEIQVAQVPGITFLIC